MTVLGIETSCDETAVAVVVDGRELHANVVASSMDIHKEYGGVVPEIAARSHIGVIIPVIKQALADAKCTWDDIDAIAVTYGAGLNGSLLIGILAARTLAITYKKPLYAINHVEAHLYANFLTSAKIAGYSLPGSQPEFPLLGLIVSGGHTQLAFYKDHFDYTLLGQTRDDAVGEAFDKVAKILGLPYPGGPAVSQAATKGNPRAFRLPKARLDGKYDFSFSGLKTAVLRLAQDQVGADYSLPSFRLPSMLSADQVHDIAASFQQTAIETLVEKTRLAIEEFQPKSVIVGGGVAANTALRRLLAEQLPLPIVYTDFKLCTDNGAMVATLGCYKAMLGIEPADPYTLGPMPNLSM